MALSGRFLEVVNGVLLVIYLGIIWFFYRHVIDRAWSYRSMPFRAFLAQPDVEGALAVLMFTVGATLIRGPVWWLRHLENHGYSGAALQDTMTVLICIGLTLNVIGGIWIIRAFSPQRCGWSGPAALTAAALVFGVGFAL